MIATGATAMVAVVFPQGTFAADISFLALSRRHCDCCKSRFKLTLAKTRKGYEMQILRNLMLTLAVLAAAPTPAIADDVRREAVHFSAGSSGATINAKLKGYQSVEYSVGVNAGQKMSLQLDSRNASLYFNVIAPGASAALYNSSMDGNGTTITIPSSGKYVIQVYLMRNAARRGEEANYTLTLYVE